MGPGVLSFLTIVDTRPELVRLLQANNLPPKAACQDVPVRGECPSLRSDIVDVREARKLLAEAKAKLEKAELNHDDSREADKLRAGLKKLIGLLKPVVARHEQNMMADDEDWRARPPEVAGTDGKPASPCPIGRADPSELSTLLGRAARAGERCSRWLAFISLILIAWAVLSLLNGFIRFTHSPPR